MSDAIAAWAALYRGNDIVQLLAAFGHILSLMYAVRFALRGDRAALRMSRRDGRFERTRTQDLRQITGAHAHVIAGLSFAFLTGLAQLFAQLDYLPQSPIFWTKMAMLALLLANGRMIQLAGARAAEGPPGAIPLNGLRAGALRSITLWCAMVILGLLLTTVRPA